MGHVDLSEFSRNPSRHMDEVFDSGTPLVVTSESGRSVVVIPEEDYEGMLETIHLLRSPRNAERLLGAIARADAGMFVERDPTADNEPNP